MPRFALLTLFGPDQPGIVMRITRILYETGCNIEDSSMTRLRGEFTVMLILALPPELDPLLLRHQLDRETDSMGLTLQLKELSAEAAQPPAQSGEACTITVVGADHPGIVYPVTRILAELQGNITDLQTQVTGSPDRPIYVMIIEAEMASDLDGLRERLHQLAGELGVEITVRSADAYTL